MAPRRFQFHWFIDHYGIGHRTALTSRQGRKLTFRSLESPRRRSDLLLVLVVGMGFLMDSYVLFTSNAILPMLGYVYWHDATHTKYEVAFNVATLGGSIFGMLLFGFLADHYGRRKLYGITLLVLIFGTFGVVTSSVGFTPIRHDLEGDLGKVDWETRGSMNIIALILWWRFVSGVGLGGDYPLTATIVAEFAPTVRRGRLLAFVFFMQAIGIAAGSVVTLIVVAAAEAHQPNPDARTIDQVWRWIIGISLALACLAMVLRLNIPESPRYTMDVLEDQYRAFHEMDRFRNTNLQPEYNTSAQVERIQNLPPGDLVDETSAHQDMSSPRSARPRQTWREYWAGVHQYFWIQGHGRWLLATSTAWWALDIAFYALSLNSPQMVSKLWYQAPADPSEIRVWNADFDVTDQDRQIYTILKSNSWHALVVTSSGALIGGAAIIYAIEHANRKKFLWISFMALGVLFLITGPVYVYTVFTDLRGIIIMLYCFCELAFYFGPNTLTFVYPAEIFPTRFRATAHGISAAAGKLGSLIIQLILAYVRINGHSSGSIDHSAAEKESNWLGWALMIFSLPMFLGAAASYWGLPEVQDKSRANLTLEEIAAMPVKRLRGGGVIGDGTGTGTGIERSVNGNIEPEMRQRFDMRV